MALQIRELPEIVTAQLGNLAARERRSISQQALILIEEALGSSAYGISERRALLEAIRRDPVKIDFDKVPTPEDLIAEDRNR